MLLYDYKIICGPDRLCDADEQLYDYVIII